MEAPPQTSVLVVDDEPQVVWMLQFSLEAEGFQTFGARDGRTALDELRQHHPQLMLLDIMMPVMDGWSVLQQIRDLPEGERPRVRGQAVQRRRLAERPPPNGEGKLVSFARTAQCGRRWWSFGTTVVPAALHVRIGSCRNSAADSDTSDRGPPIFHTSNSHRRDVFPTDTIWPFPSIQSPANRGWRNSTDS